MDENDGINFAKFDKGNITQASGTFESVDEKYVCVRVEDSIVKFKRTDGWGIGPAKFWRINAPERSKYLHKQSTKKCR